MSCHLQFTILTMNLVNYDAWLSKSYGYGSPLQYITLNKIHSTIAEIMKIYDGTN